MIFIAIDKRKYLEVITKIKQQYLQIIKFTIANSSQNTVNMKQVFICLLEPI